MRLLIVTQKVDKNDPVLGFFHRWIEKFAKNFERVTVICLGKGEYNLPANVKVLSLGKALPSDNTFTLAGRLYSPFPKQMTVTLSKFFANFSIQRWKNPKTGSFLSTF